MIGCKRKPSKKIQIKLSTTGVEHNIHNTVKYGLTLKHEQAQAKNNFKLIPKIPIEEHGLSQAHQSTSPYHDISLQHYQ